MIWARTISKWKNGSNQEDYSKISWVFNWSDVRLWRCAIWVCQDDSSTFSSEPRDRKFHLISVQFDSLVRLLHEWWIVQMELKIFIWSGFHNQQNKVRFSFVRVVRAALRCVLEREQKEMKHFLFIPWVLWEFAEIWILLF